MEKKLREFIEEVIKFHGFSSHKPNGISCFIPDPDGFPTDEGLFLWNYSSAHHRIETQVQQLRKQSRISRMQDISGETYHNLIESFINEYRTSLKTQCHFTDIGKIDNVAIDFNVLENNSEILKAFEQITVNNPIVQFAEKQEYFKCLNPNQLVWDKFFGK